MGRFRRSLSPKVATLAAIAMWLGIKREDLVKSQPRKEGDPNDPNAGATV